MTYFVEIVDGGNFVIFDFGVDKEAPIEMLHQGFEIRCISWE